MILSCSSVWKTFPTPLTYFWLLSSVSCFMIPQSLCLVTCIVTKLAFKLFFLVSVNCLIVPFHLCIVSKTFSAICTNCRIIILGMMQLNMSFQWHISIEGPWTDLTNMTFAPCMICLYMYSFLSFFSKPPKNRGKVTRLKVLKVAKEVS